MVKQKTWPLVDVIVLTHDCKEDLKKCLDSLKKCTYTNFSVKVIDQASDDGSYEMVKKKYSWVNVHRNKVNNGFVGGNNQILKRSKAKYCVLLNDDTTHDPSWITELVKVAEKDSEIGALQPKVLSMANKGMFEYAGAGGCYMDIYGYELCRGRVFEDIEEDMGQYDNKVRVFWTCGVAMFLRNSVLKQIGYLDEDFFIYYEESDLSWRMNLAGFKQVYVPSSVIYHKGSATMGKKKNIFKKNYLLHRNGWVTVMKNYEIKSWPKIIAMRLLIETLAAVFFLFKEPKRSLAIVSAASWVIFHPRKIWKKHKKIMKLKKLTDKEIQEMMIKKSIIFNYYLFKKKKSEFYLKYIKNNMEY